MAFPAEIAPSQGYHQPQGPNPNLTWPQEFAPTPEVNTPFKHPLQERVSGEWLPLLHEHGEGSASRRLGVFRDRVDSLAQLTDGLTASQLDGDMEAELADEIVKDASYVKIAMMGVATRLGIDVGSFMDKKMMEKMQDKYPPNDVYALIRSGMEPLEAMRFLKTAYNNGQRAFVPPVEISPAELKFREPRVPAYRDPYQDVTDVWQRRAFGMYLKPSERLPNLTGEIQEFFDEFAGMSESDVNNLSGQGIICSEDSEGESPAKDKLIAIGGEAADVAIAIDGYVAALGRDQEIDANAALDATIQRYRKTGRLVREGMREEDAMKLLRTVDHRVRRGAQLPYVSSPTIAAIIAGLVRT